MRIQITRKMLEQLDACEEGIDAFKESMGGKPFPISVNWTPAMQLELLASKLAPYFDWILNSEIVPLWPLYGETVPERTVYELLDVSGLHIRNSDFLRTYWNRCSMDALHVEDSRLYESQFKTTDFWYAFIRNTDFTGSEFMATRFCGSMVDARFNECLFSEMTTSFAHCALNIDLCGAHIHQCKLSMADCQGKVTVCRHTIGRPVFNELLPNAVVVTDSMSCHCSRATCERAAAWNAAHKEVSNEDTDNA